MRLIITVGLLAVAGAGFMVWRAAIRLSETPVIEGARPEREIPVSDSAETDPASKAAHWGENAAESPKLQGVPELVAAASAGVESPRPVLGTVHWARPPEERRTDGRAELERAREAFLREPQDDSRLADAVAAATEQKAWTELIDILARAVDGAPENLDRRFDLAAAQMRLRLWNVAIDQLQIVVAGRRDDRRAAYNLAVALTAAARLHEARDAWDRVVGLGADADSLARRAEVQIDLENWNDAAINLTAAHELEPESAEIALNLATALERSARPVAAEELLGEFVERKPQHVPAMMRLADRMWTNHEAHLPPPTGVNDRGVHAPSLCRRILAIQPDHQAAKDLLARIDEAQAIWCHTDISPALLKRSRERIAELEKQPSDEPE